MIKSMTGFGRAEVSTEERKFTVELKSVNHRYLDMNIKMPKKLNFFEATIRTLLKSHIERGKIDIFITYEDFTQDNVSLKYNKQIAAEYLKYFNMMEKEFGLENDIRVSGLSRYPEVLVLEEQQPDEKEIWGLLEKTIETACIQLANTRISEGENLKKDILHKLQLMKEQLVTIEARMPEMIAAYRTKIETKVQELLCDTQIDESRLATEVVLYSDKICTDEETVRLKSHIEQMEHTLLSQKGVGRKLDFIAQEMNREANTILSKANDMTISNVAIDLKTEIEKIREQIQNIE